MQSDAGVMDATEVVATLFADESRPLVQLATVRGGTDIDDGKAAYALGVPDGEASTGVKWVDVGHLNLDALPVEHVLVAGLSVVAMKYVRDADVQIGDAVLVLGADPWSVLLLQWARLQGASPLVFASRGPERLTQFVSSLGVDATLAHPQPSDITRAAKMTYRAAGFAIVLDGIASERSIADGLPAARDGGRYVVAGLNPARQIALNAYPDLHRRDLELLSPRHSPVGIEVAQMLRFSLDLATKGRLRLHGLLDLSSGWRAMVTRGA